MRVVCPECGQKSRIQKSNRISASYSDLYCSCSDPECGHTFVMNLSYSHTLSPSSKTTLQLAFNMVNALAPEHREELKQQLSIL
ncbi:ogr/Delta-like zinc finger family protein [Vibrio parahaemolyticus]|uniref:ogr/Delta-like zinc finger family protein n=1 Tax=Vibrio parahaemolyticus TaxID=670 RepID=UPI001D168C07|nr:ogr/Delta-like zinc finger family protein [Vibrio parahaemolyticus]MCC3785345.1 ogr/Delta-like zinc finger family protein [Vibrio parahaemolyticus]MCC3836642.1 ogr/Delta-like zinc finger family protein [Vibrio parahaemolyticus]MCC3837475.1 ogr/Delta-like zinc finger family protein [Vibrio parahaemolyticus]HCG9253474.1 ogr/Delta-like zinc finger family protein [Vibrio parahaemolyticus]